MNKNNVIFILFVAALLGSLWGGVVNRQRIDLEQQLRDARSELQKRSAESGRGLARVPGNVAGIQKILADKEAQLDKSRKELAVLRRETQVLETKLSESAAAIQKLSGEKDALAQQLKVGQASEIAIQEKRADARPKSGGDGTAGQDGSAPQGQLQVAGLAVEGMQQRLDEVNAQLLGLEKIVDEKNVALREAAAEKERLQINMDVLLAKIADQQRELQTIKEENRELVKQLGSRSETIDLQKKQPAEQKY